MYSFACLLVKRLTILGCQEFELAATEHLHSALTVTYSRIGLNM